MAVQKLNEPVNNIFQLPDYQYDRFFYGDSSQQGIAAVLIDLPGFSLSVSPTDKAGEVIEALNNDPRLPGVLVFEEGQFLGYLSRRKIFEWLGKPYATEVFLKREFSALFETIRYPQQMLSAETSIAEALEYAINRDIAYIYEPLVVEDSKKNIKLIDFQVLIIAQSRILEQANNVIQQQMEIGTILTGNLKLDEVLHTILEHQYPLVQYDEAGIYLTQGDYLKLQTTLSSESDFAPIISINESNIYQQVYYSKLPLRNQESSDFHEFGLFAPSGKFKTWMVVPLIYQQKLIGVIAFLRNTHNEFTQQDVVFSKAISQYAAIAIQNAMVYQEMQVLNTELEQLVAQKTKDLQGMVKKMSMLDQAKSNFLEITSGQMEDPLKQIRRLSARMIHEGEGETRQDFKDIYSASSQIKAVVERMQDLTNIEAEQLTLNFQPVDLAVIINRAVQNLHGQTKIKGTTIRADHIWGLPRVVGDRSALSKVFEHIIRNAINYTPKNSLVNITGKLLPANRNYLGAEALEIRIKDNGYGIDEKYHEVIFEKFYRLDKYDHLSIDNEHRLGLGLVVARGIMNAHCGNIWVESQGYDEENRPGSEFVMLLPVNQPQIKKSFFSKN